MTSMKNVITYDWAFKDTRCKMKSNKFLDSFSSALLPVFFISTFLQFDWIYCIFPQ